MRTGWRRRSPRGSPTEYLFRPASPLHPVVAARLPPPPRTKERPVVVRRPEPEAERYPRTVPGAPPTSPGIGRIGPPDVARLWCDGIGRDVVIEVLPVTVHPLHDVQESRLGIVLYARVERAVVPAPVSCALVELERRLEEGRGTVPGPAGFSTTKASRAP